MVAAVFLTSPWDLCHIKHSCYNAKIRRIIRLHVGNWHVLQVEAVKKGWPGGRIQVDARFSALVQTDPRAHSVGTGSFRGVKRPGRGVDHPPPSSAEVKERVELYIFYYYSGPLWPATG